MLGAGLPRRHTNHVINHMTLRARRRPSPTALLGLNHREGWRIGREGQSVAWALEDADSHPKSGNLVVRCDTTRCSRLRGLQLPSGMRSSQLLRWSRSPCGACGRGACSARKIKARWLHSGCTQSFGGRALETAELLTCMATAMGTCGRRPQIVVATL